MSLAVLASRPLLDELVVVAASLSATRLSSARSPLRASCTRELRAFFSVRSIFKRKPFIGCSENHGQHLFNYDVDPRSPHSVLLSITLHSPIGQKCPIVQIDQSPKLS